MRLRVEPDVVALAPGDVTDLLVRVHNDGEDTCTPYLQVRGVDPADVLLPDEVVAVPAGSVMTAIVRVRAAVDAIPGDQRIAIAAEDLDGSQGAVSATTVLRIGARPDVAVEVDPVASVGRRGAKARTVLRNRSDRRLQVELEGRGEGVLVSFRPSRVTLDPGETKRVPTRMRRARRSWFGEIRHGAVITARGIGAPASTTATFTQKPSIPRPAVRGVAALTALAVWVAATVVVFNRINAEPEAGPDTGVIAGPAAPGPGRTSATGMFEEDADDGVRLPVVIQGTIEGPRDPSGTTVTAERIGFGDRGTTTGLTKVVALAEVKLPRGNVLDVVRTTTDERGRFRIASGLVEEAFYRVTAVRAGFEVGSFIVSTSADQPEVTLVIALEPATGSLAGAVTDATGAPVGGATVVVTDGSAEYTTVTPSEGDDVGRWVLEGLATPATYQVLVSRRGFAAQTLIVELDGGQALRGIDAVLTADLGTIVGRITDANPDPDQPGVAQGVGALTVTLAGPEARETRTLTVAGDLRGTFDLPGLPFGDYSITFAGDGWETRQAEVTVDRGLVRLDATVNRSTGLVQGWVWQVATGPTVDFPGAFQGECRFPRIDQRAGDGASASGTRPRPCGGVAVSVESDEGDVFATATASQTGFFQIGGVPAGEYTLTLSRPGYLSEVRSIVVRPGGTFDLNPGRTAAVLSVEDAVEGTDFVALDLAPAPAVCAGSVLLTLIDFRDGVGIDPVTDASAPGVVKVSNADDCDPALSISRIGDSGTYLLQNVPLGPQTIALSGDADVWAYQPVTINAQVSPLDRVSLSQNILPRPRDLTIPAGMVRLEGPAAASRDVTLEVIDRAGNLAADASMFTPFTISGGSSNPERTIQLLSPDRDLRLRIVGGEVAGVFRGYPSVGGGSGEYGFELPPGLGAYTLPVRDVTDAVLTGGVATLTTAAPHGLAVGDVVLVSGVGAPFDSTSDSDTRTITAVTEDTLSFARAAADVPATTLATTGTVRRTNEAEPLVLPAQTRVSGTVRGFSADTTSSVALSGATVTFPAGDDGVTPAPVTTAGDGAFSRTIRSGVYGAAAGLDPITVTAPGYATRTFLPDPGRALTAPTEVLRAGGAAPFLLYPDLAGAAGDVGLDPSTRRVTIATDLLGGTGSERSFRFELRSGTVAGEPVRAADGTLRGTVATSSVTLGIGTAAPSSATLDLGQVPVGSYTLVAVPDAGERIALRDVAVTSGTGSVSGSSGIYTLVVPPGTGDLTLSADMRARTLLTGKVLGFDLPLLGIEALQGATVTVPSDATLGVEGATTSTGADGTFSVEIDAADYGTGTLGALTVAATGYDTRSFNGAVAGNSGTLPGVSDLFLLYAGLTPSPLPDGDVGLDPAARTVTVPVLLVGVAGASRTLTVELLDGEVLSGAGAVATPTPDPAGPAAASVVAGSGTVDFAFAGVRPGTYTLRITGTGAVTATAEVTVPVGTGTFTAPSAVEVVATTTVTGTVHGFDASLAIVPMSGATVAFPVGSDPADASGTVTATSAADGTFTATVRSGVYTGGAGGLGAVTVTPPDASHMVRTFAVTLAGGSATLRQDGVAPFLLNPALTTGPGTGTGEFILEPATRDVIVDVSLLGAAGAVRPVTATLTGGTITGVATATATASTVPVHPSTVTVGTAGAFGFTAVAPGSYTVTIGGSDHRGLSATLIVAPGLTTLTDARSVRATVAVTVTVSETVVLGTATTAASPVTGAVVAATSESATDGSDTTGEDGTVVLTLDSGAEYALSVTKAGYASPSGLTIVVGAATTQAETVTLPAAEKLRVFGEVSDRVRSVRVLDGATQVGIATELGEGTKSYAVDGLPTDKLLRVDFRGDDDTVLVSRWIQIQPDGARNVSIQLDQNAEIEDLGTITVDVEVPEAPAGSGVTTPATVTVRLIENVPAAFYSVSATGVLEATSSECTGIPRTCTVTFAGLAAAASSTSLPATRFTVAIDTTGGGSLIPAGYIVSTASSFASVEVGAARTFVLRTVPGAPEEPTLLVVAQEGTSSQRIDVSWSVPSSTGGAAPGDLTYVVGYRAGDSGDFTELEPTAAGATSASITGLAEGTEYEVRVRAVNTVGGVELVGADSPVETATTADVPGAPTDLLATATPSSLSISWAAPAANGGSAITSYTVTVGGMVHCTGLTTTSCEVTGLEPSTEYLVEVTATNAVGTGAAVTGSFSTEAEEEGE